MEQPKVTIIVPTKNEEKHIAKCLESILQNDYPKDKLEILIVDGMSVDNSRNIAKEFSDKLNIKLLDDIKKSIPAALNIGIKDAKGDIVIRMDAHSFYPSDYISKCIYYLKKFDADNVGGVWKVLPGEDKYIAKAISYAVSHPFGVGYNTYRLGVNKPIEIDTVPFGCYKKKVFEKTGVFDERLPLAEDYEFNHRLLRQGGKIYLIPEIISYYHARTSLRSLWNQYFKYGYYKARVIFEWNASSSHRHFIPSIFILSLIASVSVGLINKTGFYLLALILLFYISVSVFVSAKLSNKNGAVYIIVLPIVFLTIHISYGSGFLKGIFKTLFKHRH